MMSLSDDKQTDIILAFNTTDIWTMFKTLILIILTMVSQIYPSELQLNKANTFDTEATILDLHLSISNYIVSTKIYDKRDDCQFPILDGEVPRKLYLSTHSFC